MKIAASAFIAAAAFALPHAVSAQSTASAPVAPAHTVETIKPMPLPPAAAAKVTPSKTSSTVGKLAPVDSSAAKPANVSAPVTAQPASVRSVPARTIPPVKTQSFPIPPKPDTTHSS